MKKSNKTLNEQFADVNVDVKSLIIEYKDVLRDIADKLYIVKIPIEKQFDDEMMEYFNELFYKSLTKCLWNHSTEYDNFTSYLRTDLERRMLVKLRNIKAQRKLAERRKNELVTATMSEHTLTLMGEHEYGDEESNQEKGE